MRWQAGGTCGLWRHVLAMAAGATFSFVVFVGCSGGDEDGAPEGSTASSGAENATPVASAESTTDGSATPAAPVESSVGVGGVTLTMPAGWVSLDDGGGGLIVASVTGDLSARVPAGPRFVVAPASTALPDAAGLVDAIEGVGAVGSTVIEVVEEPESVPVGVSEGVAIGLLEEEDGSRLIRRYVIVNVDGQHVYQFVLEAPEELWAGSVGTLDGILESVVFGSLAGGSAN